MKCFEDDEFCWCEKCMKRLLEKNDAYLKRWIEERRALSEEQPRCKRKVACVIRQNPLTCGEWLCGCGWPRNACRAIYPDVWAVSMLHRDGLWNHDIVASATLGEPAEGERK